MNKPLDLQRVLTLILRETNAVPLDMPSFITLLRRERDGVYEHLDATSKAHAQMSHAGSEGKEPLGAEARRSRRKVHEHLIRAEAMLEVIGEEHELAPDNWAELDMVIRALESNFPA